MSKTLYEYAGFMYSIEFDDYGMFIAIPEEGQHSAANKWKHRMAAVECYREDKDA